MGSKSAKALAQGLDTRCVREHGKYKYRKRHLIINWGNSRVPGWQTLQAIAATINKVPMVAVASDKIQAFQRLQACGMSASLPEWTVSQETAKGWLSTKPYGPGFFHAVICRKLTHANSGRGIVLAKTVEDIVPAPLYTRYKPKVMEFRIHVANGVVIDTQQKKKNSDVEEADKYIRSHDNGWVFCREGIEVPDNVAEASILAVQHLGLDFGAVDVGYHPEFGLTIYEVNTAPGLEGQTLASYLKLFNDMVYAKK
jgi:glutathione synthase/RimK-type ligase-like ATP-grasp enzyme